MWLNKFWKKSDLNLYIYVSSAIPTRKGLINRIHVHKWLLPISPPINRDQFSIIKVPYLAREGEVCVVVHWCQSDPISTTVTVVLIAIVSLYDRDILGIYSIVPKSQNTRIETSSKPTTPGTPKVIEMATTSATSDVISRQKDDALASLKDMDSHTLGQLREATVVKVAPTRPLASRSFWRLAPLCDHWSLSNLQ